MIGSHLIGHAGEEATVHSFPGFELDEERFELRRDGQPVKIEPRVLEVLAYLIRSRGRVVTKEELLDQVWKKNFVSESALTRCVMEARRAIGEGELIKTVHGRGYRFDAPEEPEEPVSQAPVAIPVEVAVDPRRWPVALSIALMAMAFGGWLWARQESHQTVPQQIARVALLPIAISEEDRELQMVGMSIADLLEQRLGEIGQLRVRGADYSRPISLSARSLVEVAKRAGVDSIISGSLAASSKRDRVRLVLVLHQIREEGSVRDTPLGTYSLPLLRRSEEIAQYVAFRERVVSRVVTTVLPALKVRQPGAPMPRDSESYRLYLLARERLATRGCDGEAAIELLRRSLEIDDRFAPAWNAYAWALYGLASTCTEGAEHYRMALGAADRTLALSPDMGSAIALKSRVLSDMGRVEEAYRLVRDAARKNSGDADLSEAHFAILAQTGFIGDARMHLVRVDPNHLAEHGSVATSLLYAAEWQRFIESLPESGAPRILFARGFAEMMQGRPDVAHRTLEPLFRNNPADAYARLSHALLAVIEGRKDEARAIVRHFVRQRELVGETGPGMTYLIAQLAALAGDEALSLRELEDAVNQGFCNAASIERDAALAPVRATSRYARALERAQKRHEEFAARLGLESAAVARPTVQHVAMTAHRGR